MKRAATPRWKVAAPFVGPAGRVLMEHLVDEPGNPTREALDRVLAFFQERLTPA